LKYNDNNRRRKRSTRNINATVAVAVAKHREELEIAYIRRKEEFLKKYGMKSLPTNRTKTALE